MKELSRRTFLKSVAVGGATMTWAYTGVDLAHAAGAETFTVRIVHTNDHHARVEPVLNGTSPVHGGVSRRKAMIDAIRSQGGNQILLDAGDVFQGTLWFNQYRGLADAEFYNAMGYEAMTIGNHEFDLGQQPLANFAKSVKFPIVSANLVIDPTSPLAGLVKPYVIKWFNNEPVGIFGLTTEETVTLANPGRGVAFADPVRTARWVVEDLRTRGVKKIIALTHIGINADLNLARSVEGISVIVGGHSHTPQGAQAAPSGPNRAYPEVVASPSGKPVIVATDWEWGRWLGDLTVGFDANGEVTRVIAGRTREVAAAMQVDQGFEGRIAELARPINDLRRQAVGSSAVELNGARADVRAKETNLGNLVADSQLAKTRANGVRLALVNSGGIRTGIPAGPVTFGQVLEVAPFGNTLITMDITGAQVKEALENGVSRVADQNGRFPQVAGMRFTFDSRSATGSRVSKIEVAQDGGFVAIDPAATYRIVVNNFAATGGDGYSVLLQGRNVINAGFVDSDVLAEYIQNNSPVNPKLEGRITNAAG
ncbi:MAG: 5'-nucleotidase C-terminal domain-containing protein [Roseiflexaceae bacterium]|nr:5'-nucleotidase C-terminal domain-containing protein [Roseiflexaceae bacterium]